MKYLQDSKIQIHSSTEVAKIFHELLLLEDAIDQDKEHFYVMHLDIRSRIKMVELVQVGTMSASLIHPTRNLQAGSFTRSL